LLRPTHTVSTALYLFSFYDFNLFHFIYVFFLISNIFIWRKGRDSNPRGAHHARRFSLPLYVTIAKHFHNSLVHPSGRLSIHVCCSLEYIFTILKFLQDTQPFRRNCGTIVNFNLGISYILSTHLWTQLVLA